MSGFDASFIGTHLAGVMRFDMNSLATSGRHCVFVSVPESYATHPQREYPLLLVLDANLIVGTSVETARVQASTGEAKEVIVACVGTSGNVAAHSLRRLRDYLPDVLRPAASGCAIRGMLARRIQEAGLTPEAATGGAQRFLEFLEAELAPVLASRWRIMWSDVGLAGHSAGAMFATYALLSRAALFSKYIIGSSPGPELAPVLLDLEAAFVKSPLDRDLTVFHALGGQELRDEALGPLLRSADDQMVRLSKVPRLRLDMRILPGETHASAMPQILASGLRALWPGKSYVDMAASRFA